MTLKRTQCCPGGLPFLRAVSNGFHDLFISTLVVGYIENHSNTDTSNGSTSLARYLLKCIDEIRLRIIIMRLTKKTVTAKWMSASTERIGRHDVLSDLFYFELNSCPAQFTLLSFSELYIVYPYFNLSTDYDSYVFEAFLLRTRRQLNKNYMR